MNKAGINQIQRFNGGISTAAANDGVSYHYPYPDPLKAYVYFNDFINFTATDWTITETQAGATQALQDGAGGQLLLTNTAADNDQIALQLVPESFRLSALKRCWFECRFQVSDATQVDWFLGLVITDTSVIAGFTDGIGFRKDDGDTQIDFTSLKNSAGSTSTNIATFTAATFTTVGFFFDGNSGCRLYVDGLQRGFINPITFVDDEDLTPTIVLQNGEAVAKTMTVDYILAAVER